MLDNARFPPYDESMGYAARRQRYAALYDIACEQSGVFTAKQAVDAGFDARNHPYHVKSGYWEKAHRGIYRLVQFPIEPSMQYATWSLWSCNRKGEPQGVYSHETALNIYELSDLDPPKLHMTVPAGFRRGATIPEILVLYRGSLKPREWREGAGYRVTTPVRTLYDVLSSDTIAEEFVYQTVKEGLSRGMFPKHELERYGIARKVKRY